MNKRLSPAWTLAILTGLNLFNYVDRFVLPAVLPPLQAEMRLDDGSAGRLVSQFIFGYFISAPLFGYMGDRYSRKWLIAGGIFVWSLGTMMTGMAHTFGMLLFYRVLVGFGEASYATLSPSLISDNFKGEWRNKALTIFYVAIPVGAAIGNIMGGEIAKHYSWRHAFIWAGAPGLLLALVMLPFKEPERGHADGADPGRAKPTPKDVLRLFVIPDYMLVVLGYAAYTFSVAAFGTWGPSFFVRAHGMDLAHADRFFGIMLVGTGLLGTFTGGYLASWWHTRNRAAYAWTLGISVMLATPLALMGFMVPNQLAAQGCLAAAMFLLFMSTGPVNTLTLETVPANLHASAMAVSIFTIHLLGDWKSSEIVGKLSTHWGLPKAVLVLPGFLFVAGVFWLALAFKTARRKENEK